MTTNQYPELAPAVESILAAARDRPTPDRRLSVDARDVRGALAAARDRGDRPVIAEVKPTSPTTDGRRDDDPVALAERMVEGGAAALSVLTEPDHFGGSTGALRRVRAAVDVPVLRKDFVLEPGQVDAVAADAVLVIARFVDDLPGIVRAVRDRGMTPLVEVHDRSELERALAADAALVGVNNRDLATLTVDLSTGESVLSAVPDDVTAVAESGIGSPADADRMLAAGADGLLVGTAIVEGDVRDRTRRLVSGSADAGAEDGTTDSGVDEAAAGADADETADADGDPTGGTDGGDPTAGRDGGDRR